MSSRAAALLGLLAVALAAAGRAPAFGAEPRTVYVANDNHTDYGWNATVEAYEASMLAELDYYLDQIDATAGAPPAEQARFDADCWWYLYLYEQRRSPAQLARLLDAIRSGHVTVPLNPFVELYGALPTEAAIRAGYYPGRVARRHGLEFPLAQAIENATIPWGLASLWAGSGARYSWKGICECAHRAPYLARQTEVFRWQGPDGRELLMKWYQATDAGSGRSWGGYAEAADNLSPARIQAVLDRFAARPPFLPVVGLFGAGWDDVTFTSDAIVRLAQAWNATHAGDAVVVSNALDYFARLEPRRADLPVVRGGWGNDWDMFPAALAARTAQTRRAVEQLRTAEALAAVVRGFDPTFWAPYRAALNEGWNDYFKYFEHTWGSGGVDLATIVGLKKAWADHFDDAVRQATAGAAARFATLLATPAGERRFAVFNPLGFARTDAADLPVDEGSGPFVVTDVATGEAVPSQLVAIDGARYLRILARAVPSLGYRTYRYAPGTGGDADCCAADAAAGRIDNGLYRVALGGRGQLASVVDLRRGRELAASGGVNDFGSGAAGAAVVENAGPVSATLRVDVAGAPARRVAVTLLREVDRVEIDDTILDVETEVRYHDFAFALADPQLRFEEVGALARPGSVAEGGDFQPGTRAAFMTLNHFADVAGADYHVTLSNWDAYAMRIGASTDQAFDLAGGVVRVLAAGNPNDAGIRDQGGEGGVRYRFALRGGAGAYDGAEALRASLAHQNPLRAIALPAANEGPLAAASASFLGVDAADVVLTAIKPAEEDERGLILRLWELGGKATTAQVDATALAPDAAFAATHIETDVASLPLAGGRVTVALDADQLVTVRLADALDPTATTTSPSATPTSSPPPSDSPPPSPPVTATPPATASASATRSPSAIAPVTDTATPGATRSGSATHTQTPTPSPAMRPGDLDQDGRLSGADLALLVRGLFDPDPPPPADVNGDGRTGAADLPALIVQLGR